MLLTLSIVAVVAWLICFAVVVYMLKDIDAHIELVRSDAIDFCRDDQRRTHTLSDQLQEFSDSMRPRPCKQSCGKNGSLVDPVHSHGGPIISVDPLDSTVRPGKTIYVEFVRANLSTLNPLITPNIPHIGIACDLWTAYREVKQKDLDELLKTYHEKDALMILLGNTFTDGVMLSRMF